MSLAMVKAHAQKKHMLRKRDFSFAVFMIRHCPDIKALCKVFVVEIYVERKTKGSPNRAAIKKTESPQSYNQEGLLELLSSLHTSTNTHTSTATQPHTHKRQQGKQFNNTQATCQSEVSLYWQRRSQSPGIIHEPVETVKRLA